VNLTNKQNYKTNQKREREEHSRVVCVMSPRILQNVIYLLLLLLLVLLLLRADVVSDEGVSDEHGQVVGLVAAQRGDDVAGNRPDTRPVHTDVLIIAKRTAIAFQIVMIQRILADRNAGRSALPSAVLHTQQTKRFNAQTKQNTTLSHLKPRSSGLLQKHK
jgi:hypothetical protein